MAARSASLAIFTQRGLPAGMHLMDICLLGLGLFDPLALLLACGPLAAYLLVVAGMHLTRRPVLVTGMRDTGALAVGMIGLVTVGPLELFMPQSAAELFGPLVWILLLGLYGLCVVLAVLLMRPRLIVYNLGVEQLRPLLVAAVQKLDDDPRWAGECLSLPRLGVQVSVEGGNSLLRHVQLVAVGSRQDFDGWRRLEHALRDQLRTFPVEPNPWAGIYLGTSAFLILIIAAGVLQDPPAVLAAFREKFSW